MKLTSLTDSLRNIVTGMGTSVDKSQHRFWHHVPMDMNQIENAYRSSWLMRKIVDLPCDDMTREWRVWELEPAEVARLEEIEAEKHVQQEILAGLIYGRLGGGAVFIGTDADPSTPMGDGEQLLWVKAMPRQYITLGDWLWRFDDKGFGEPGFFKLSSPGGTETFHHSRVLVFKGERHPGLTQLHTQEQFWGDSVVEVVNSAVQEAMATTKGFSSLVDEARVDVFKFMGLAETLLAPDGDAKVRKRVETATLSKSLHRAVIMDKDDDWETRTVAWQGMPDVIKTFLMVVAGAADIPATRLYGKAPDGQNSTGESDDRNYRSSILTRQNRQLRPALLKLDRVLLSTANVPGDAVWAFSALDTPTDKEKAAIDKQRADTAKTWADTGLIPEGALALGVQSMLVESGTYPALKEELAKLPDASLIPDPEDNDDDPSEIRSERDPDDDGDDDDDDLTADAKPRTLIVKRPVANSADLIRWAKAQGFATTLPADDLHVTIVYSKAPLDWMKVDEPWNQEPDGTMTIPPGSARLVEQLGDKGAIVLLFNSSRLSWRHEEIRRAGASHGFPDYQPHITISYQPPEGFDLDAVEPYRGPIRLGPEVFAEINPDWQPPEES